jgi:hypothetical protein
MFIKGSRDPIRSAGGFFRGRPRGSGTSRALRGKGFRPRAAFPGSPNPRKIRLTRDDRADFGEAFPDLREKSRALLLSFRPGCIMKPLGKRALVFFPGPKSAKFPFFSFSNEYLSGRPFLAGFFSRGFFFAGVFGVYSGAFGPRTVAPGFSPICPENSPSHDNLMFLAHFCSPNDE